MEAVTKAIFKEKRPQGRTPKYTPEYYMMMVKHIVDKKMSYREASKLYKVSHGSIAYWVNIYKEGKLPGKMKKAKSFAESKDARFSKLESYIQSLKTEIGELYLENQMLKKAQIYLQQQKVASSSAITSENLDQWRKDAK